MGNFRQEQGASGDGQVVATTVASGCAVVTSPLASSRAQSRPGNILPLHVASVAGGQRRSSSASSSAPGSGLGVVGANSSNGQPNGRSASAGQRNHSLSQESDGTTRNNVTRTSNSGVVNGSSSATLRISGLRDQMSVEETRRTIRGTWPNNVVAFLCCMSCLLGMYNISRFSLLVYVYKGSFILQFLILSVVIGLPFLHLLMTLGQFLGSGIVDMWYISPAFKGIGFAIVWSYCLIGVYSAVPISWLFVFFRDSFITTRESYKWAVCQPKFAAQSCIYARNSSSSDILGWTVSSYYHGRVLDRKTATQDQQIGEVKFEIAFHLGVVWLLIFICLSRGLRSLSKVMYVLGTVPLILFLLIAIRFMEQWGEGVSMLFTTTWQPFMTDSMSWQVAAREVMWTWGVFGAAILNICSHNKPTFNVTKNLVIMVFFTLVVLLMGAFFFASTAFVLSKRGLVFVPSSYEEEYSGKFLFPAKALLPMVFNISASNLFLGNQLISPEFISKLSGYEVLRFATEIFPAALASEGVLRISSFWSISFYLVLILMALAQQLVIWQCVIESLIALKPKMLRAWQSFITFITCNIAFLLGLPMTTNIGIFILYFFDFCVGSLWWLSIIYLIFLIAVLFIRGRPYGTDQLVAVLVKQHSIRGWLLPVLTFQWNVVLPLSFLVISIAFVRTASVEGVSWTEEADNYGYWPRWVKRMAVFMQLWPLIIIAIVGAIQAIRFLSPKHAEPLHERVQSLCCPIILSSGTGPNAVQSGLSSQQGNEGMINSAFVDDPPPKYTPPPSYSTATARIIAQQVREQISIGGFSGVDSSLQVPDAGLPPYSPVYLVSYDPKLQGIDGATRVAAQPSHQDPSTGDPQCQI